MTNTAPYKLSNFISMSFVVMDRIRGRRTLQRCRWRCYSLQMKMSWRPIDCICNNCFPSLSSQQRFCCDRPECITTDSSDDKHKTIKGIIDNVRVMSVESLRKPDWIRKGSNVENCSRRSTCYIQIAGTLYEELCEKIPRCVVKFVHDAFPDKNGIYTGWHSGQFTHPLRWHWWF